VIIISTILLIIDIIVVIVGAVNLAGGWDTNPEHKTWYQWSLIGGSIGVVVYSLAICGAISYNLLPFLLVVPWVIVDAVMGVLAYNEYDYQEYANEGNQGGYIAGIIAVVIWALFVLYIYITFAAEVKSGMMSKETYYTRELQSCCCV